MGYVYVNPRGFAGEEAIRSGGPQSSVAQTDDLLRPSSSGAEVEKRHAPWPCERGEAKCEIRKGCEEETEENHIKLGAY